MRTYHVTWEIDIDANNPTEAAVQALQTQKDWQSIAKVFKVTNSRGQTTEVDLCKLPELSLCDECGGRDADVGCPDGAQICQDCFDRGLH